MTMKKRLSLLLAATFIGQSLYAGCEKELFTINSERGLTIHEVIDQLSAQCQFSLVLKDEDVVYKKVLKLMVVYSDNVVMSEEIVISNYNTDYNCHK